MTMPTSSICKVWYGVCVIQSNTSYNCITILPNYNGCPSDETLTYYQYCANEATGSDIAWAYWGIVYPGTNSVDLINLNSYFAINNVTNSQSSSFTSSSISTISPNSPTPNSASSGTLQNVLSGGAIDGIVVGGIVVITEVIYAIFFIKRRSVKTTGKDVKIEKDTTLEILLPSPQPSYSQLPPSTLATDPRYSQTFNISTYQPSYESQPVEMVNNVQSQLYPHTETKSDNDENEYYAPPLVPPPS